MDRARVGSRRNHVGVAHTHGPGGRAIGPIRRRGRLARRSGNHEVRSLGAAHRAVEPVGIQRTPGHGRRRGPVHRPSAQRRRSPRAQSCAVRAPACDHAGDIAAQRPHGGADAGNGPRPASRRVARRTRCSGGASARVGGCLAHDRCMPGSGHPGGVRSVSGHAAARDHRAPRYVATAPAH